MLPLMDKSGLQCSQPLAGFAYRTLAVAKSVAIEVLVENGVAHTEAGQHHKIGMYDIDHSLFTLCP
jgi:hypothetical protein